MKTYIKLDDEMLELFEKLNGITLTDYEIKNTFIDVEGLVVALRDLMVEYGKLEEECQNWQERYTDKYYGRE